MGSAPSPYDAAIEELEGQIRHLQSILDSLKILRTGSDGSPLVFSSSATRETDSEIRHDTFFGMTIADAARKYLGMVKQTKSTAEVAEALERGGLKHASRDFSMTVRAVISPREEFVRVNNDWGLTEWYPGQGRGKKPKTEKNVKPKAAKPKTEKVPGGTRRERILHEMKADPGKAWTAGDIAKVIGDARKPIQAMMVMMAKDGELVKDVKSGYRIAKAQAA